MEEIRFEPNEIREAGEKVVVDLTLRARGKSTGLEVEQRIAQVWELRNGKAISVEVFATMAEALDAAGG
jgi:ketosteroid isomerase-like protein